MKRSNARFILAILSIAVGASICAALIYEPIPEANKEALLLALGIVLAWGGMGLAFYFGTSQGSADKTELLERRPDGTPADPVHTKEDDLI